MYSTYNPLDHYWSKSNEIYASKRNAVVLPSDSEYMAWCAAGGVPTPWPDDLSDVLRPYGIVYPSVSVQSVTMRQARLALLAAGQYHRVAIAIDALPSPQKEEAQIEWEYSQTVERNRGFVLLLGAALGLTAAQLDALFVTAAAL